MAMVVACIPLAIAIRVVEEAQVVIAWLDEIELRYAFGSRHCLHDVFAAVEQLDNCGWVCLLQSDEKC